MTARGIEDVDRAQKVDRGAARPVGGALLDRRDGRQVQTRLAPLERLRDGGSVADIAHAKLDTVGQTPGVAGGEVIEHTDLPAVGHKPPAGVVANEPTAACNQDLHAA